MIRYATQEELPQVVELVKMGAEELGFDVYPPTLADSIYRSYMLAPQLIYIEDDKIVCVASLTLGSHPWSQVPYLTTNMVFVLKKHRKPAIITEIYNYIKKYANLQRISYYDTFIGTDKIDGRLRLLRSHGLEQTGISMKYEV